jgi:predicted nucleotidyltransferase
MESLDLNRHVAEAAQLAGARVAIVFGSRANGRTWHESDLDVAVRWERGLSEGERRDRTLQLIGALTDRLGPIGERADVLDIDRGASAVAFRAIQQGKLVFVVSESERVRCIVDVVRRYDDDAPLRRLFRKAAQQQFAPEAGGGRS